MKLRDYAAQIGLPDVGCGDSACIWGNRGGMCTNGGCRCGHAASGFEPRLEMRRFARLAQYLADKLESTERDLIATVDVLGACQKERDGAVEKAEADRKMRSNACVALAIAQERIAELERKLDAYRKEAK